MKSVFILAVFLVISGCAAQPKDALMRYDRIEVDLDKNSTKSLSLVGERSGEIAKAAPDGKKVELLIPKNADLDQCFSVADRKGKPFDKLRSIELSLPLEYQLLLNRYTSLKSEIDQSKSIQRKNSKIASKAHRDLNSNSAFDGTYCVKPPAPVLPAKPRVACDSRDECVSEGSAICYSRFIGVEGCAIAAREVNVKGILASLSTAT